MMNLTISEIANACHGRLVLQGADENQKVTSVVLDSRKVTEGGVFLATPGERVDGHSFIQAVFEQKVALVICQKTPEEVAAEQGIPQDHWGSYCLVENTLDALKELAEYYRGKLDIPIVGITGSVGKTSTKEFIATVLAQKYQVLKNEGNFNNEIGVPLTLLRIREEHDAAVVEMGISDFGEMHRLSKMVRPNYCVMTNIGQCHLENLKTRDGILQAKSEIFDFMAEDGEIILNGDDDKLSTIQEVNGKKPHYFGLGLNDGEEIVAKAVISKGLWGSEAILVRENRREDEQKSRGFQISVSLPGAHMVINAACAALVGELMGLEDQEIARGIAEVRASAGRGRLLRVGSYTLIDDCYNANPVSTMAALDLLMLSDTERTAILGDMFELGGDSDQMHAKVGRYAMEIGVDRLICVGKNSLHMYEEACKYRSGTQSVMYFETKEEFAKELDGGWYGLLGIADTILIKASRGMHFEDLIQIFTQEEKPA